MTKKINVILFSALGIVILILSLCIGSTFISPAEILKNIAGNERTLDYDIIMLLRLPRVLMALVIGAALAVSGVMFQALLKNPLSDPYTIGVSGGAALGATMAIILSLGNFFVVACAFAGSLIVISAIYILSRRIRLGTTSLILGGIALSFIFSSCVLLIFAVSNAEQVHKAMFWLMGDLSLAKYGILRNLTLLAITLILTSIYFCKHLNIISFGDSFAVNMGVSPAEIKNIFWIASLLSAVSVSLAGVIGFVGLIIPHAVRAVIGPDHRALLPVSAVAGGLFLAGCDALGRSIAPPYEIPVGIITGFVGGIFFLVLLIRKK